MESTSSIASQDPVGNDDRKLVVVIDTDPGVRWAVEKGLARSGYRVLAVNTVGDVLRAVREEPVDALVMELLPEAGLTPEVLTELVNASSKPRVVCVAVDSAPQNVIDCMRRGAADFLPKPFSLTEVRASLNRALESKPEIPIADYPPQPRRDVKEGSRLIGISPAIQELREAIVQVARTDLNCLIRGESGTGKDMVARELHRLSDRSAKPFIKVNCTALPEQLLESELFGYEKGAFTGAHTSKPGRFELANRGMIFLDEIGDMDPNLQSKLLQVIEHKEFTKLGGTRHINVDVQIIAATNADLEKRTREGLFRDDLYFRLNEVSLWVPPLSERKEDVPLLVRHFLQKHVTGAPNTEAELSGEDLATLTEHNWPGNVRELESTIKRWLALGRNANLPLTSNVGRGRPAPPPRPEPEPLVSAVEVESRVEDQANECEQIVEVLERYQWNRRKAADELGMSYQTLRRRIEKYGLDQKR
jgi:two-component system, NtrC family, response regulator AtoC